MNRKAVPQPLDIGPASANPERNDNAGPKSSQSLSSPSSPRSPFRFSTKPTQSGEQQSAQFGGQQSSRRDPGLTSSVTVDSLSVLQQQAQGGQGGPSWDRPSTSPARGGFFSNYRASKPSNRSQPSDTIRQVSEQKMSRGNGGSSLSETVSGSEYKQSNSGGNVTARRPVATPSRSDTSIPTSNSSNEGTTNNTTLKKNKPKPFSLLGRTKSIRSDRDEFSSSDSNLQTYVEPDNTQVYGGMKTAPIRADQDRTFRDIIMNSSTTRNRSADRQPIPARDIMAPRDPRDNGRVQGSFPTSASGHAFLSNLKNGSSKAVFLGKGLLNKVGRSGSTTERDLPVDDEHYVLRVLNLPLVEQTRLTRISKKLEDSRDKTEFWMPSFPWRAIDYLNYRGTEVEGLYRVPGSGPQIKKWQRRFDEELDVDLFAQEDLYDINIIGSMLKAWLRELPDELFPKASQDRISRECAGAETVPQLLVDELSNLPPFNYYLLFAITCHLSLLLEHSDKNKMNFQNLCICFQPCMKIDRFNFKFLVVDWRDCWRGCKTEDEWTNVEYRHFDMTPPPIYIPEGRSSTAVESHDERNVSSADSSKPSSISTENQTPRDTNPPKLTQLSNQQPSQQPSANVLDSETMLTTLTISDSRATKRAPEMQQLSPITPLSPMRM